MISALTIYHPRNRGIALIKIVPDYYVGPAPEKLRIQSWNQKLYVVDSSVITVWNSSQKCIQKKRQKHKEKIKQPAAARPKGGGAPRFFMDEKSSKIDFYKHAQTFLWMLYVFLVRIKNVVSPLKYFERCIETRKEINQK